jgi:hypothetical protein
MRTTSTRTLCVALAALCLVGGSVQAQGRGKGNDKVAPGLTKVPPGLAKKGGLPPGQAKKIYRADDGVVILRDIFGRHGYTVVRTVNYGDSRYVYYRFGNGTVRRAVVIPGTERPRFSNVPDGLLREVMARMF